MLRYESRMNEDQDSWTCEAWESCEIWSIFDER